MSVVFFISYKMVEKSELNILYTLLIKCIISFRFDIPKCPPGSEEKVSIQSSKENKIPCVHIIQGFIINEDSNRISKSQYIWIPAKKRETKEK